MKITILTDNTPAYADNTLVAEHGLSLYIERGNTHILCDTGASSVFMNNAEILGINLANTNLLFLSHGHNDHCGGARAFLQRFADKRAFVHPEAVSCRFYSSRRGNKRDISATLEDLHDRMNFITSNKQIAPGVTAVMCNSNNHSTPQGNIYLTKEKNDTETPDDFAHELSLAIETTKGLVIVSPCSHRGAVNIIESCCRATGEARVYAFIGGLHFVDSDNTTGEVATFKKEIETYYPHTRIITGHCTCDKAKEILSATMPQAEFFSTGYEFEI